jgi:RimJ/RimL family protein N-acetyltransferase
VDQSTDSAIETNRLLIRPIFSSDKEIFLKIFLNEKVVANADTPSGTPGGQKYLFEEIVGDMEKLGAGEPELNIQRLGYAIIEKTSETPIGFITFRRGSIRSYFETSTALSPVYWGKGYGYEARNAVNQYLFSKLKIPGLISVVSTKNMISRGLTEKLGFKMLQIIQRENAEKQRTDWIEYRQVNPTINKQGPESEVNIQKTVTFDRPVLDAMEKTFYNVNMPSTTKAHFYYKEMLKGFTLMSLINPEYASKIADDLAYSTKDDFQEALKQVMGLLRVNEASKKYSMIREAKKINTVYELPDGRKIVLESQTSNEPATDLIFLINTYGHVQELRINDVAVSNSIVYFLDNGNILEIPSPPSGRTTAEFSYLTGESKVNADKPAVITELKFETTSSADKKIIETSPQALAKNNPKEDVYTFSLKKSDGSRFLVQQLFGSDDADFKTEVFFIDPNGKATHIETKEVVTGMSNTLFYLTSGETLDVPSGGNPAKPSLKSPVTVDEYANTITKVVLKELSMTTELKNLIAKFKDQNLLTRQSGNTDIDSCRKAIRK